MTLLRQLISSTSSRATVIRVLVLVLALLPGLSGGIGVPKSGPGGVLSLPMNLLGQAAIFGLDEEHVHPAPSKSSRRAYQRRIVKASAYLRARVATAVTAFVARPGHPRSFTYPRRDPDRWTPSRRGPPSA